MFSDEQKSFLAAPLSRSAVKTRTQSGRSLSYIEGWHAIAEANRIFGFDGWARETIDYKCVSEREREIGSSKAAGWSVTYIAKVRVTVGSVVREGCGTGHGIDRDLGQAHESAIKESETDAMKRCLMTFGNPFGLALYDKEQAGVSDLPADEHKEGGDQGHAQKRQFEDDDGQLAATIAAFKTQLSNCETQEDVQQWVELREGELKRIRKHSLEMFNDLRNFKENRIKEIIEEKKS